MRLLKYTLIPAVISTVNAVYADNDNSVSTFKEAITQGDIHLNFRYRLEEVSQDNPLDDALASTLRTRLTLKTKSVNDFSFLFEVDDVSHIGNEDEFNSLRNGITTHSVVADPEATNINQSSIIYTGFTNTKVTFGRQRINLNNQRFVGGVAWRQNEQTFDGLSVHTSFSDSKFTYAYVNNVNDILNENLISQHHFLNYQWQGSDVFNLAVYGILLDFDDNPNNSTSTFGIRAHSTKKSNSNFMWTLEFASQSDYADNANNVSESYLLWEAGYKFNQWVAKIGQETLTGDATAGQAFQTPLATKHKFQGWADLFLATPSAGVEDTYIALNTKMNKTKFAIIYHDFTAEDTNADYGTEIDFVVSYKVSDEHAVAFKYADYEADQHAVDTRKIWLSFIAKY